MDFRRLRYFHAVAKAGSFSRAATEIDIAQPALSRQIKQLEDELGALLFYRDGRGVHLTPAGELLIAFADSMIDGSARVAREIRALGGAPQASLSLGVLPSLSTALLEPLVVRLHERHPGIRLNVREAMSGTMMNLLQDGKVDIAVVYEGRMPSSIVAEHLLADAVCLVRRPRQDGIASVSGAMLERLPLVMPCRNHGIRQLAETQLTARNLRLDVRFEIDSVPTMKRLVATTDLATLLTYGAVAEEVRTGELEALPLVEPALERRLALATSGVRIDAANRIVVRAVQSVVHEIAQSQHWTAPARFARAF
ncbi:LysR family transcriptional regulator [Methylobacterium terricola]|uniref:LysR family transcriptional regulator n=1 Tax=Methylobacterium terricola TaxID=2583531 RepID=A0A5C4LGI1_9HYPH|nr:LysR family transcriptional regulator [Methylobacterium terricola]TNC11607.1 LysR family transcriptional regulator [Methylobacterium terricola]